MAILVYGSWPIDMSSLLYPDSMEYITWPSQIGKDTPRAMGPRMVGYPAMLAVLGRGSGLVAFQHLLLLTSFGWLGWQVAGRFGCVGFAVLSLAPAIHAWGRTVLTESPSISGFALLLAMVLWLHRRPTLARVFGFALVACLFAWLRPSNLALLPFLLLPFWNSPRRIQIALAGLFALILIGGAIQVDRGELWRTGHWVSIQTRVQPDTEARAYFRERGLPNAPFGRDRAAFYEWFDEHAEATFRSWIFGRPESYVLAWQWLHIPEASGYIDDRYFARWEGPPPGRMISMAGRVYDALSIPPWLWLIAFVVPAWQLIRQRASDPLPVLTLSLAAACYAQTFLSYHGSGSGEIRHLLLAQVMIRLAFLLALTLTAIAVWNQAREREAFEVPSEEPRKPEAPGVTESNEQP